MKKSIIILVLLALCAPVMAIGFYRDKIEGYEKYLQPDMDTVVLYHDRDAQKFNDKHKALCSKISEMADSVICKPEHKPEWYLMDSSIFGDEKRRYYVRLIDDEEDTAETREAGRSNFGVSW